MCATAKREVCSQGRASGVNARFGPDCDVQLAERVLVGVDDISARHDVQRAATGWLHVGGTTHFEVMSSVHQPDAPCVGCLHPPARFAQIGEIPTISFVSELAGTLQAYSLLASTAGVAVPGFYCWANNVGGASGVVPFVPHANPRCALRCEARRGESQGPARKQFRPPW